MKALYEKIVTPHASSFKAFSYQKPEFDTPWHYHPEYELTYIVASSGVRYVGNNFENFEPDDLVLLGSNLPHCWKNTRMQEKACAMVFHWDDHLLGKGWTSKPEFVRINDLLQSSAKGIKFDKETARRLKPDFLKLLELPPFGRLMGLLEILHTLALCKSKVELCAQGFQEVLRFDDHERINTIYQYVRNHVDHKITLSLMAAQVHMSEESFSRFFSKTMGKPFFTFLNEYRINAASKLLIETDQQIAQISYACGFESLPFFYRQFKKYRGNSPRQFRMEYRKLSV